MPLNRITDPGREPSSTPGGQKSHNATTAQVEARANCPTAENTDMHFGQRHATQFAATSKTTLVGYEIHMCVYRVPDRAGNDALPGGKHPESPIESLNSQERHTAHRSGFTKGLTEPSLRE